MKKVLARRSNNRISIFSILFIVALIVCYITYDESKLNFNNTDARIDIIIFAIALLSLFTSFFKVINVLKQPKILVEIDNRGIYIYLRDPKPTYIEFNEIKNLEDFTVQSKHSTYFSGDLTIVTNDKKITVNNVAEVNYVKKELLRTIFDKRRNVII